MAIPTRADTTGMATEKELAVESCEKPWKYASETSLSPLTARNAVVPVDRRNASRSRSTTTPPWRTGTVTAGSRAPPGGRRNRNGGGWAATARAGNRWESKTSDSCQTIIRARRERSTEAQAHP